MTPCPLCGAPAVKAGFPVQQPHCPTRARPWLKCLVCKHLFRPIKETQ